MTENDEYKTIAESRTGFLPQISDTLDHIGAATALARRYAALIQTYPAREDKSLLIVGITVATIVWLSAARKTATYLCKNKQRLSTVLQADGMLTHNPTIITIICKRLRAVVPGVAVFDGCGEPVVSMTERL